MGNHTFLGSPTSLNGIAQPTAVVLGRNLVKNLKANSTPPAHDKQPPVKDSSSHSSPSNGRKPKHPR
jgi:hypothetical protein